MRFQTCTELFVSAGKVKSLRDTTPAMIRRAGNVSGAIGHELVRLFARNVGNGYLRETTATITKEASNHKAVGDYVTTYIDDALVYEVPGRKMTGGESFNYTVEFSHDSDAEQFFQKVTQYSELLDYTTWG